MSEGAKGIYEGMKCPAKPTEKSERELRPLDGTDWIYDYKRDRAWIDGREFAPLGSGVSHTVAELHTKLDALAESQGKLLARLDAMDAGLHETAMRNHQQLRKELGDEIEKVEVLLLRVLVRPPRKASKKARRR